MDYEFDPAKNAANIAKHGLPLDASDFFEWDIAKIEEDTRFEYDEQRFKATGLIGNVVHVVIYCEREDMTRIISLRKANKKEARDYADYYFTHYSHPIG